MNLRRWFSVYIVPGAVFQSVLVGGGYGTGRETVEYVTQAGAGGGVVAVALFFLTLTLVLAASFEFARVFRTYDYRHFFQRLLGRAWWLFEALAVLLMVLILAVVISAAVTMVEGWLGVPGWVTTVSVIAATGLVLAVGQSLVQGLLSVWAALFSVFVVVLAVVGFSIQGDDISRALAGEPWMSAASLKGVQYALYNIAAVPLLLYTVSVLRTRREAMLSALIAGAAGALPALLMHLVLVPLAPGVLSEPLPVRALIDALGVAWLVPVYTVLLLGTIVQTAIGVLEGVVKRVDGWREDQGRAPLAAVTRGLFGAGVLSASAIGSVLGVIALIGSGYGTMAWGFMLVYAVPLLTLGLWKIRSA